MLRPTHVIGLFGLLLVAGCSSSSAGGTTDAGTSQDTSCEPIDSSFCGQPCQPGNSLGVGAFCNDTVDCTQLPKAHLCATLGDPGAHFCTFRCSVVPEGGASSDAGDDAGPTLPTDCGQGASCKCGSGGGQTGCACTPDHC